MRYLAIAVLLLLTSCTQHWIIEACAASSRPDYNGHKITREALHRSQDNLLHYPTVLFNHDHAYPIGRVLASDYKDGRLFVRIEISPQCPEIWALVQEGVLTGLSISWMVLESDPDFFEEFGMPGLVIRRMIIVEVSICSVPANPDARIVRWYVE